MYLIPKPKAVTKKEGNFCLSYKSRIVLSPGIREDGMVSASILKECMETWTGFSTAIIAGTPGEGDIFLNIESGSPKTVGAVKACCEESRPQSGLPSEAYRLEIRENGITLTGGDGAGVFYAVQTLCQIFEQQGGAPECIFIEDAPDVAHRGYYLDVTRGRVFHLDYLKKTVDRLCRYKVNELQLYIEHTYMFAGLSEMWRDETPLTAEEIMELDKYCRERYVELVPSLSSFGHLYGLLSTRTYGELCELENSWKQPFSFLDRMHHHTVNVGDERVMPLIKRMLAEYMALFSSDKFNLCADETFDLGRGKAKDLADEKGVHRIYIDHVKELCSFLAENGKQPMFWGDIICGEPELISELPENVICLTWGYEPDQDDESCRKMAQAGARQYLCPGVRGWNQWLNQIGESYQNIARMCTYAKKYGVGSARAAAGGSSEGSTDKNACCDSVVGILNTDWGDFGHINHPDYAIPGMIYGAAFSWNQEIIPFEEMNRQIARVAFHDTSEELVNLLAKAAELCLFKWWGAEIFYEKTKLEAALTEYENQTVTEGLAALKECVKTGRITQANAALLQLREQIKRTAVCMDASERKFLADCDVTLDGIAIWNEIGAVLARAGAEDMTERFALAARLESWFMVYKEMWRSVSKEGDLAHVAEVVFWYADLLRGRERSSKALPCGR